MVMKNSLGTTIAGLALWALSWTALAQDNFPTAPLKVVVPYPPGASTDAIGRLLAQKLSTQMNASAVVENKAGANGNIGADFVAKSRPDGHTILFHTSSLVLSPAFGEKVGYDMFKDMAPVALVAAAPLVLFVTPSVPVNTTTEFIAHLKAHPDKIAYGSTGVGSITHLGALLFLQASNLTSLHVPYKGGSEVVVDVAAGRVQFGVQSMVSVLPFAKDKRVKVLGVGGLKRSALLPDVPTLAEAMPGFEIGLWFGVLAPVKTPPAIVRRLNAEIMKMLQDPDAKVRLARESADPLGSTPEEYGTYLKSELERWTRVIKTAGVKLD
jgi:tripartite-type tricarboxylate transporter receptor subunit TctC